MRWIGIGKNGTPIICEELETEKPAWDKREEKKGVSGDTCGPTGTHNTHNLDSSQREQVMIYIHLSIVINPRTPNFGVLGMCVF